jgi:predicted kinase
VARIIVVIFGLIGTGKTTLARALGEALDLASIHSDAVRKSLAGLRPTTPAPLEFGQGIYAPDFSARTYTEMHRRAGDYLAAGRGVILDASYKRAQERARVRHLAREHGAKVAFVYCDCPFKVVRERLGIRLKDPTSISDGREELLAAQAQDFDPIAPGDRPLLRLNTNRELGAVVEDLKNFVTRLITKGKTGGAETRA